MLLPVTRGGLQDGRDLVVKNDQTCAVALQMGKIDKSGSKIPGVIEFCDYARRKTHAGAGIQKHHERRIGFSTVAFQIRPLGAGKHVPIDLPQIVARRVGAIFGELLAETEVRGSMQSGEKTFDDGSGHEIQARDSGQDCRIEKPVGKDGRH